MTAALAVSLVLAAILGFSAHRASVCTVRAVAEAMHARTAFMFASIGKSVLWILTLTVPLYWFWPELTSDLAGWQLSAAAVLGGFLFGVGSGLNGACAYSTMARLVDGEAEMVVAIAGFALGVGVFIGLLDLGWLERPITVPPAVGAILEWGGILAVLLIAWAIYEGTRLWRSRDRAGRFLDLALAPKYRLSSSALVIGVTGSAIFLLFGSAGYSSTFEVFIEGAYGTRPWPTTGRWLLLVAVLLGMLASTLQRRAFRVLWRPRLAWLRNFTGGTLMGLGVAMAPGGNDAIVLYGVPSFSPNAIPAFVAMAVGIVGALALLRVAFGIETRATCRADLFVSDTWTPEGKRPVPAGTNEGE